MVLTSTPKLALEHGAYTLRRASCLSCFRAQTVRKVLVNFGVFFEEKNAPGACESLQTSREANG
jgi:hypothetical protein